jgi:hypothetical protein
LGCTGFTQYSPKQPAQQNPLNEFKKIGKAKKEELNDETDEDA